MQDETINLVVTRGDLPVIGEALGCLPYKQVANLIARLNAQLAKPQPVPDADADDAAAGEVASGVSPS